MSPFIVKAIQLLLSLSLLIVLHELGHFIPAKLFKTRVEKFYLFFDVKFSLFKKKIGETVYGIGWLPLGGYVKISGMIDESMDKEQMAQPPQPWEFRSKPAWQRLIIMLGGVTVNIIVGFAIYMMVLFVWGSPEITNTDIPEGLSVSKTMEQYGFKEGDHIIKIDGEQIDNILSYNNHLKINTSLMLRGVKTVTVQHQDKTTETLTIPDGIGTQLFKEGIMRPFSFRSKAVIDTVAPNTPAATAGIVKGDKFLSVNNSEINSWQDFKNYMVDGDTDQLIIEIENNGILKQVTVVPDENGIIGVSPESNVTIKTKKYSIGESITSGFSYTYWTLSDYISQFKYVFTKEGATKVGGFGAIGNLFPDAWDWQSFWATTALISIILAFMNILPIPALDGGHVMFLLYEMVTGRKPNDKFMEYAQMVGFFILIALVLFANGNDIYRWLFE
ncbi:RIP metalloprotease RseP [Aequorivita sp. Q41]|uniref:RIP metalloprotease RseP n=1 Tax=Aequorivita sp. Q41 TaxID=3153300 RepID=UPI0032423F7C